MNHIKNASIQHYGAYLKDKYRPPSKGGNTRAWHQHVLTVGGEKYSFLALGAKKWAWLTDTLDFDWEWDESGKYRNIIPDTVRVFTKSGVEIVRGHRGTKKWRTAETRLPVSRREARD